MNQFVEELLIFSQNLIGYPTILAFRPQPGPARVGYEGFYCNKKQYYFMAKTTVD